MNGKKFGDWFAHAASEAFWFCAFVAVAIAAIIIVLLVLLCDLAERFIIRRR